MSRTNRGNKPQGHDMWGARPCAGQSNSSKKTCRRVERQQGKQITKEEIDNRFETISENDGSIGEEIALADEEDSYYNGLWEEEILAHYK